jgi:hypothetical protein
MTTTNNDSPFVSESWTTETETLIQKWCDRGKCYNWMHYHAYCYYYTVNLAFQIPLILLSTLIGSVSFAGIPNANIVSGSVNIFIGSVGAVYGFLQISQLTEQHRIASLAWDQFQRNLEIVLLTERKERTNATDFFKINLHEYNKLLNTSPFIPPRVVNEFNRVFAKSNIDKPDICTMNSAIGNDNNV